MDERRFDGLARAVATGTSRRGFVGGLVGLAALALGEGGTSAQTTCPAEQAFRRGPGCVCKRTGRPPVDGRCPCSNGGTYCPAGCVDLARDPANCGGCERACPPEAPFCAGGGCVACTRDAHCDDLDPCTIDTCVGGACQHAAVAQGGPCVGQTGMCCAGVCQECCSDADCGADNACADFACSAGACVATPLLTEGAQCAAGRVCVDHQCVGNGVCNEINYASRGCGGAVCDEAGTVCTRSTEGGWVCLARGSQTQCTSTSECPAGMACVDATCGGVGCHICARLCPGG